MPGRRLRVATCQFSVSSDIDANAACVMRQMRIARRGGADIAHFSECALSGYLGIELSSERLLDYDRLTLRTEKIVALAQELKLWVVLGSTHRISAHLKPHNALYVIGPRREAARRGRPRRARAQWGVLDRYDKMFCTGKWGRRCNGDLKHYSAGDHFVMFALKDIKIGLLICHDYRYPELYRRYKRMGAELILHSFHNAGSAKPPPNTSLIGEIVRATMQTRAASNYLWVSANNSSRKFSSWPSFVVRPDGKIVARARPHTNRVLITEIDVPGKYYDASVLCREGAMKGVLHSGRRVRHARSRDRQVL